MNTRQELSLPESVETVVIGGGQAGLAVGHHLARLGRPFLILDGSARIGDAWRKRWDSLRLYTLARFDGLPGMPFPAHGSRFPTKDEVASYLEAYARRFRLPVHSGMRVDRVAREDGAFVVVSGDRRIRAENVVVAMSSYQRPFVPAFHTDLAPEITRLHSSEYRNPGQLRDGRVLVVGAADSGSDIALETALSHETWLSGPHPGHVPFRIETVFGRNVGVPLVIGQIFHNVLSVRNPLGRKVRPKLIGTAGPNVRVKPADIRAAGVERVPRTVGVRDGLPLLEDGRVVEARNVIWCTGFRPDFSWIDLPVFGGDPEPSEPVHREGVVPDMPGLYFVGLFYLTALTSSLLRGVGRDAERIAGIVAARMRANGSGD